MFDFSTVLLIIALLFGLVFMGVHVAVALGIASAVGIYMVTGKLRIVEATMASTAAEALRDFTFAVIPLFMLMGEFIGRSGAIGDIYVAINRGLRRIPARLAIAPIEAASNPCPANMRTAANSIFLRVRSLRCERRLLESVNVPSLVIRGLTLLSYV